MTARLLVLALLALALVAAAAAHAAVAGDDHPPGALRFFADPGPPPAGGPDPLLGSCIATTREAAAGTQRCAGPLARGLDGAAAVALSPDPDGAEPRPAGDRLYVASPEAGAVAVLTRDAATGVLDQADDSGTDAHEGCISEGGQDGCVAGVGLRGVADIAVSPDGGMVYAASRDGGAVAAMRVAPDGSLTQQGLDDPDTAGDDACVSEGGQGGCVDGRALAGAAAVAVSPDGATVYAAAADGDAVAVLRRTDSGALRQPDGAAGCVRDPRGGTPASSGCASGRALDGAGGLALDPSASHLYVAARGADAVAAFRLSADGSVTQLAGADGCLARVLRGCRLSAGGLDGATAIAFDPSGRTAYVAAADGDALLAARRAAGGGLSALRCYSDRTERDLCTDAPTLDGATSVTVSPDGRNVYAAARNRSAIGTFRRVVDGTLRLEPVPAGRTWTDGCSSLRGHTWVGEQDLSKPDHSDHRCARALGLYYTGDVAVSPDGGYVYAAAGRADALTALRRLPAGGGWSADDRAPGTRLAGPRARVRSRTAGFVVAALGGGPAVLECRLDREPWRRCANPVVRRRLRPGRHVFRARAVDASGNADASPARVGWRILPRR